MTARANPFHPLPSSSPLDVVRAARDWSTDLPPKWRPVWILLATYYPNIFPNLETLAQQTGVSRATVARYVKGLNDIGAIQTVTTGGGTTMTAWRMPVIPETGLALPVGSYGPPSWVELAHAIRNRETPPVECH